MSKAQSYKISVFEGDGIGPEITAPALKILDKAQEKVGGFSLDYEWLDAGALHYQKTGDALPETSIEAARKADAILLSCMGLPNIRKPDGTEITPQVQIRFELDLYAGVRPVKILTTDPCPLKDERVSSIDFVLIRESTEGLFAHMNDGVIIDDQYATEKLEITRQVSEKVFDFAFKLSQSRAKKLGRQGQVICIDKANVFKAFWFFRSIFEERAKAFPDVASNAAYVDAFAMWMVQRPWDFDVVVTENMFGDILSDLGAGIMGSLGLAPSADIGDNHAVFQPCHGTAPDIAGRGVANPAAMFLSASLMLDWLSDRYNNEKLGVAARLIEGAVSSVLQDKQSCTADLGGEGTTDTFTGAVLEIMDRS